LDACLQQFRTDVVGLGTKKIRLHVGAAGNRSSTLKSRRVRYSIRQDVDDLLGGSVAPDQFGMIASNPVSLKNSPATGVLLGNGVRSGMAAMHLQFRRRAVDGLHWNTGNYVPGTRLG
jgi:hypothetical protein